MSWDIVRLGDVCNVIGGYAFKSELFKNEGIPLLRISNIVEGEISFKEECVRVQDSNSSSLSKFKVQKNDILVALSGATTGKFGVYKLDQEAFLNQRVCLIRATEKLDQSYFSHYLNILKKEIIQAAQGAAQPNISTNEIIDFKIPLPPLPIQKRIAEILDAADALKRKDQELLKKYDELAQAIFIDMFGDPVKNEKGFSTSALKECLEKIQIGPFGTQLHESDYIINGVPIINPMHIGELKVKPNPKYSITHEKFNELPQYHLAEQDVILARRGEMGRCAIITKSDAGFLCGTGSMFLKVSKEKLDPLFLVYLLSRKSVKKELEKSSTGTTMSNLNKTIIGDFEIITPDLKEQIKFKDSIQLNQHNIELIRKNVLQTQNLFNSLIQKAFKGELVA